MNWAAAGLQTGVDRPDGGGRSNGGRALVVNTRVGQPVEQCRPSRTLPLRRPCHLPSHGPAKGWPGWCRRPLTRGKRHTERASDSSAPSSLQERRGIGVASRRLGTREPSGWWTHRLPARLGRVLEAAQSAPVTPPSGETSTHSAREPPPRGNGGSDVRLLSEAAVGPAGSPW